MNQLLNAMKQKNNLILRILRIVGTGLGLGLLGFQIFTSRHNLISFLHTFGLIGNIFLSLLSILTAIIGQITIWFMIMRIFDVRIKFLDALFGYTLAFLPKYIPGAFWGYLSRNEWLSADFGIERRTSTMGTVLELLFMAGATTFMAGLYYLPSNLWLFLILFLFILVVEVFILHQLQRKPIDLSFLSSSALKPIPLTKILILNLSSIGVWFIYGLGIYFLSKNDVLLIRNTEWISSVYQYSVSFSLAWTAGFLVFFVPSGIGVREGALANLIALNEGFNINQAYQIALVFRLVILVVEISMAILGYILKSVKRTRYSRASE